MGHPERPATRRHALLWALVLAPVAALAPACDGGPSTRTEPMELQGQWLGMRLSPTSSPTAQRLGVLPELKGVVVANTSPQADPRASGAGIRPGDVIVAVDGTDVASLTDLYSLTTELDTSQPLSISIVRGGQPMSATIATGGQPTMGSAARPVAAPAGGQPAATLYCPTDGVRWSPAQVAPSYRCPRCGGPLTK